MENENKILNKVLNGEIMAANIMNIYSKNINDANLKQSFDTWINDHNENADKLKKYLEENGYEHKNNLAFAGYMAQTKAKINTYFNTEPLDILHEVYDGEDKGIARSAQISKGDLSPEATEIIEDILSKDHEHLKAMEDLISTYESN